MNKKYRLEPEGNMYRNRFRIIALRDIPRYDVKAGDWGGRVSGEHNLCHEGDCWIGCDARMCDSALVCDDAHVCGNASVWGNVVITDNAIISNKAVIGRYGHTQIEVGSDTVIGGTTRLYSGIWNDTPKVIKGSRYDITYNAKQIAIGCECHPLGWWEEHGLEVAEKDGFALEQIEEYRGHLDAIKKEYVDDKEV